MFAERLWQSITSPGLQNYFYMLILVSVFFFSLELLFPWRKDQAKLRKDFWLDSFYMFFNMFIFPLIGFYAISNFLFITFKGIFSLSGSKPFAIFDFGFLPTIAQLVLLFIIRDLVQYFVHRLLHSNNTLWQFHKVHHSVKEMGFAAHLRYHPFENIFYRLGEFIPLGLLGFSVNDFFIVYMISLAMGHFNHSNIAFNIGFLGYIFNNPRMHIWHHAKSVDVSHKHGANFGLSLSAWDFIFGTANIPESGRDEILGFVGDDSYATGFIDQQLVPFKRK